MTVNIWGKGGLFEQRLAERGTNETSRANSLAQEANTREQFSQNRAATDAFRADTERATNIMGGGGSGPSGLRSMSTATGGGVLGSANPIGNSPDPAPPIGTSSISNAPAVGGGRRAGAPVSMLANNGYLRSYRGGRSGGTSGGNDSGGYLGAGQTDQGSDLELELEGRRKGGRIGLRGYQNGGQVHRMPRGYPRVQDERPAIRGPSTVPAETGGTPRTDKQAERARIAQ